MSGILTRPSGLIKPTLVSSPYAAAVLADSPLAYYRLGEPSGSTMVDSSGNGRDGTYTSVTLGTAGLQSDGDTAATFNGTSSKGVVADAAWQNPTFLTVEAFIKDTNLASERMIASRDTGGSTRQFQLYVANTSHKLSTNVWNQAGSFVSCQSAAALSVSTVYHVAVTWDGTTIRLYINGVADGTASLSGTSLRSCSGIPLNLANLNGSEFWPGILDEFAIYGTALSAARIAAHYAAR